MFGSKLRSWMENHIVRPRKKGNKNKNGTSSNLASSNCAQNGHKGTGVSMYQGADITTTVPIPGSANTISSPARRSEVSPIQSHTTSRIGWQSPQQEMAMSPKSDHYLYLHSVKSHTLSSTSSLSGQTAIAISYSSSASSAAKTKTLSPNSMPRKSSYYYCNTQESASTTTNANQLTAKAPPNNTQNHNNQSHNSHQQHLPQVHQNHHHQDGRSQQQQLQNQTPHSHHHRNKSQEHLQPCTNHNHMLGTSTAYSISDRSSVSVVAHTNNSSINQMHHDLNYKNNNNSHNNNNHSHHNSENNRKHVLQQQQQQQHYNSSGNNSSSSAGSAKYGGSENPPHHDESRYGKILPSKKATSTESFAPSLGSYDNLNANIHFQTNSNGSNNNHAAVNGVASNKGPAGPPGSKQACHTNGSAPAGYQQQYHPHHHHHQSSQMQARNGTETNRNILRTNRYNGVGGSGAGGVMLNPANNHPLAHVINTLSSPESAYSTGYSTDGTSPGATYTPPEYYINMRTGTHYFPKGVNTLALEANRYKFGLNKIEEMSPQDPVPNSHRRTESFDLGQNKIPGFGVPDPNFFNGKSAPSPASAQCQGASPVPQRSIVLQSYKGFESPSPRQRCRIRTNPWYSTTETSSSGGSNFLAKKIEIDASSSSSGIKSSSDAGASDKNEKNEKSSDSESASSSTEVEVAKRSFSPGTIRRRKITEASKSEAAGTHSLHQESDEDATLNEMMGKFDESYVYEKETDILSDSDPTDCASDLDTGQDAGDECDTDELLDIDFIDTGSIQEIIEKDAYKNTGSCSYFNYQLEKRASRLRRGRKQNEDTCSAKRKKRLLKTRKKSTESKDRQQQSPIRRCRESRSLGGTPVCLRRNQSVDSKNTTTKIPPLANRSNSLTFTEVHAIRGRFVAIAESEKALLKADLEADVKYKQLIHEAETILVTMKTGALRETPVASPRRVCNLPTNKRVEMLRNCEADLKREVCKQQKAEETANHQTSNDGVLVNKRLEMLKYETNSAPNSPKAGRFSPRKTHVTNFINQNAPPLEAPRRSNIPDPPKKSPQLQLNGRSIKSPPSSPGFAKRRVRSQSPRTIIYSDSDTSEEDNSRKSLPFRKPPTKPPPPVPESEMNGNRKNDLSERTAKTRTSQKIKDFKDDLCNRNIVIELEKMNLYNESDYANRNIIEEAKKPPLMSFRSIDMGNRTSVNSYCPQSEPLKRKIYTGSSTFERIKKSLDLESEIPKKAILEKISNLRRERQALKTGPCDGPNHQQTNPTQNSKDDDESTSSNISTKHQLILDTIEDLKRSLEDQSVELCGLNDDSPQ